MKAAYAYSLAILALFSCKTVKSEDSRPMFGGGEHMMIGNRGFELGCPRCPEAKKGLVTKVGEVQLTYGEIVAFSGDFYGTPESLDENPYNKSGGWFGRVKDKFYSKDIAQLKELFAKETAEIIQQQKDATKEISDNNIQFGWNNGVQYLELAEANLSHFGWHNMKNYVKYHGDALALARKSYEAKDIESKQEFRRKAILTNGFADHFLTDGFAAGHIRVPRKQAVDWGVAGPKVSGILSKILHDNDSSSTSIDSMGLRVQNSRGDSWSARGDGDLYRGSGEDYESQTYIKVPLEAVEASVKELVKTLERGELPRDIYAAARLVPFADPNGLKLTEKFKPSDENLILVDKQLEGITGALARTAGLNRDIATKFYNALPTLMEKFRADVAADLASPEGQELKKRLPAEYIKAYLSVQ